MWVSGPSRDCILASLPPPPLPESCLVTSPTPKFIPGLLSKGEGLTPWNSKPVVSRSPIADVCFELLRKHIKAQFMFF